MTSIVCRPSDKGSQSNRLRQETRTLLYQAVLFEQSQQVATVELMMRLLTMRAGLTGCPLQCSLICDKETAEMFVHIDISNFV